MAIKLMKLLLVIEAVGPFFQAVKAVMRRDSAKPVCDLPCDVAALTKERPWMQDCPQELWEGPGHQQASTVQ